MPDLRVIAVLDIEEIRAQHAAATPGPWTAEPIGSEGYHVFGPEGSRAPMKGRVRVACCTWQDWDDAAADAEFIARARTDVPLLLAEVERLREALAQSEGEREDLDTGAGTLLGENVELRAALEEARAESQERLIRLQRRERAEAERLAKEATIGDTGICRTCVLPITYETVEEPGYKPRTGWSDGARSDALVCFKAIDYRHVPIVGRERGIWDAATKAAEARATAAEAVVASVTAGLSEAIDELVECRSFISVETRHYPTVSAINEKVEQLRALLPMDES